MKASIHALVGVLSLCGGLQSAEARTWSGAVYESGQVVMSSGARLQNVQNCEEGLLFTFAETAMPDPLTLSRRSPAQANGEIELVLSIVSVCEQALGGQASFAYGHRVATDGDGEIGTDVSISGLQSPMVVMLSPGQSQAQLIQYQALGSSVSDHAFELFGDTISFFTSDAFGTTDQFRQLARIEVGGATYFDPEDPAIVGDDRLGDSVRVLEDVCLAAEPGTELAETCDELAGASGEDLARLARAFDAHEVAAVPGAALEMTRIQSANVGHRLHALRSGSGGFSVEGLGLTMNGFRLDAGLVPDYLAAKMDGNESSLFGNPWGFFINGDISIGKRKRRGKEVGFDFDSWGVTSGIDYRFRNGAVVGLAVGYSVYDAELDEDGGALDASTWSTQLYGSIDLLENLYLDGTLAWSSIDFDLDRVIDLSGIGAAGLPRHLARGSTSGDQLSASLALNYRVVLNQGWQTTPYLQYRHADTDIDGFTEQSASPLALRFPDQDFKSSLFAAGLRVSRPFSLERGVMVPYADLAFEHERGNDGYSIQPFLVAQPALPGPVVEISSPDRSFGRLDLGSSWVFLNGTQVYASYSVLLFDRDTRRHSLFLGARWEF